MAETTRAGVSFYSPGKSAAWGDAMLKAIARGFLVLAMLGAVAFGVFAWYVNLPAQITAFTSMTAKLMCSAVFVARRSAKGVWEQDFVRLTWPAKSMGLARLKVDYEERAVTSSLAGFGHGKAIWRKGVGCTALVDLTEAQVRAQGEGVDSTLSPPDPDALWPEGEATLIGDRLPPDINAVALERALDRAFAEPEPARPRKSRAVVIVHRGHIIAERYASGFGVNTGHLSQSMAKSVLNALAGILVGDGKLALHAPAPVREWSDSRDPRHAITLDHLLRMSSGLSFDENYTRATSDTNMQYTTGDFAAFTATKPLESKPGVKFNYSTGTSNIIGRIVREAAGPSFPDGFAFARKALFDPIGMRTAVIETDAAGSLQGGSFVYASARDYARLALLFMNDGVWNERRILPDGWVKYTLTPTPGSSPAKPYGAHFWLNAGIDPNVRRWPNVPADAFIMSGILGQNVVAIPSRDLVVVRVGLSEFDNWDVSLLVEYILGALAPTGGGN
jgi:CubicO group peptidase (beta-lactamase class C family)